MLFTDTNMKPFCRLFQTPLLFAPFMADFGLQKFEELAEALAPEHSFSYIYFVLTISCADSLLNLFV